MLENLAPLYQAIAHGCRGGRHQDALKEIYLDRICRRTNDGRTIFYATRNLGGFSSNLAAISWFFDKAYEIPVAALKPVDRSWVQSQAALLLRSQARFAESFAALRESLQFAEATESWQNAAARAGALSETELSIGEVDQALSTAIKSVEYADNSGDAFQMVLRRTSQAAAMHALGRREEAELLYADAERRQQEIQPIYSVLYSGRGYDYCDLVLSKGAWEMARERAQKILDGENKSDTLLDHGVVRLALGRANLGLSLMSASSEQSIVFPRGYARTAHARLEQAIEGLRDAGEMIKVCLGYLARSDFRRSVGDWDGAARDLDEVEELAEPGPMRLYLCDMALERTRLAFARIEAFAPLNGMLEKDNLPKPSVPSAERIAELKSEAEKQLKIAADYIEKCGYHRRDEELAELQAVLRGKKKFAELPPRV
jgi:tetratricopeptide (TPR) repeat protein